MVRGTISLAGSKRLLLLIAVASASTSLLPMMSFAQQVAREGITAQPGDITVQRQVGPNLFYAQPKTPGEALFIEVSPSQQVTGALGISSGELSDNDVSTLSATPPQVTSGKLSAHPTIGGLNGVGTQVGTTTGVVTQVTGGTDSVVNATRGIGNQISAALAPLPGMASTPGNGH